MSNFCIVTPFHKNFLSEYEKLSFKSILKHFNNEDKYLITYHGNNLELENYKKCYFNKRFFESINTYNQLCFNLDFYKKFSSYKYILICHLDVIVIHKNNLNNLIEKDISYIGAPSGKKYPLDRSRKKLWGRRFFCNGGFSLRKTSDFIKVLSSDKISMPFNFLTIYECLKSGFGSYTGLLFKTYRQNKTIKSKFFTNNFHLNEDVFWTYFASIFYKKYKLPTLNEANNFAFDGDPYFFYKKNQYKLPMGLHGHHNYLKFLNEIDYRF